MAGYVILGTLAAFGLFCVLWVLLGWILSGDSEGLLLLNTVPGEECLSKAGWYLWLRSLGLLRCPIVAVDTDLSDREKQWLSEQGIEICTPRELSRRLGIGAESN